MQHQTKSNNAQANVCGKCGGIPVNGVCPRGCKKEAKVPKWMLKTIRHMELNQ